MNAERKRLEEDKNKEKYWRRWGPYLSERQWGTVREDYSPDGNVWKYFNHDKALWRIYRWGEDGIAGLSDNHGRFCFAVSLWNGVDPCLKERLFGLSNPEGNHGEDVKEIYYYLDNTPSHAYMKYLYKYPQKEFPYQKLIKENQKRTKKDREFEIIDTGVFDHDQYFDVFVEYAKNTPEDIAIKLTIYNRGGRDAVLHLLPTFWAHNLWKWNKEEKKPILKKKEFENAKGIYLEGSKYGSRMLYGPKEADLLFTENDCYLGGEMEPPLFNKDAFHRYVVDGHLEAINSKNFGTKAAFYIKTTVTNSEPSVFYLRFSDQTNLTDPFEDIENIFLERKKEADAFYADLIPDNLDDEHKKTARQAFAGMLWNKQFYYYVVERWLSGDPPFLPSLPSREEGRNCNWKHVYIADVLSVPDKWEYPGLYAWDTAFHALPFALLDPDFIKEQLTKLIREWYMHPSGALPAYEWSFNDVNPPVHAWACWRAYKIEKKVKGAPDYSFLEQAFHKLLLNFTWWVNRKDMQGKNIFQGGFLGLDNISIFNRSEQIPEHAELYQSDATSWMGMYCLNMLAISLELAWQNSAYEDMASKFYEHFLRIADAINLTQDGNYPLWNEEDGFYYDVLKFPTGEHQPIKVRSLIGLMPLLAVMTIEEKTLHKMAAFTKRMNWFIDHRRDLCEKVSCMKTLGVENRRILAILDSHRLRKILKVMLDEQEFLSPYGIRSLSKYHEKHSYKLQLDSKQYCIDYEPGESTGNLFGGNSNWRGPIWFPLNILFIESLQKFHHYYGDTFQVECPTGSGNMMDLWQVSCFISKRLLKIFTLDERQKRPIFGEKQKFQHDPHFKDYLFFNEYFHGDTGEGLGALHQTGWTGLISKLIIQLGEYSQD
ncbi:MAG: glucosidase [Simkaniaceae bacterium]